MGERARKIEGRSIRDRLITGYVARCMFTVATRDAAISRGSDKGGGGIRAIERRRFGRVRGRAAEIVEFIRVRDPAAAKAAAANRP